MYPLLYEPLVRTALLEDLGRAGDITSEAVLSDGQPATAAFVARQAGTIAGIDVAAAAMRLLDPTLIVEIEKIDGSRVQSGDILATVRGSARAILSAERTALNFLGHLSGIATSTRQYVEAVRGTKCHIVCTRKTTPGLRALEKMAVRLGGGFNHRFGLDDAVLIKDNHVALAGGVTAAIQRVRERVGHLVKIELEVDTFEQVKEALAIGVDLLLLDNMTIPELEQAVSYVNGRAILEASGSMRLERVGKVAATGVDLLSVGQLTHSSQSLDVALDIDA